MSPIDRIVQWNQKAGLLDSGYDDFLESSFQIEEALEGFSTYDTLLELLDPTGTEYSVEPTPKEISRIIVDKCYIGYEVLSDVDRLDKACDAVVFAVGSMAKLGLTPSQITAALDIVMDANDTKLTCHRDSVGKLVKPSDFPAPEPRLQALLDSRKEPV